MKRFLKWISVAVLAILVQAQLSFLSGFFSVSLILVYFFGLRSRLKLSAFEWSGNKVEMKSVLYGALVGLMEDIFTGSIIGPGLLSKGLIGLLTPVAFTDLVFKWTPLWGGIVIVLFTLLDGAVLVGARTYFTGIHIGTMGLLQIFLLRSLVSLPFGILLKP
ncbi:MAG: hypothetical protein K8I29_12965 [Alphaproteobacteria bacterium]|uniref:Rod shape-determining protein MreD n=1 Tax=Candidatus Nitrobium versatile TaxID=2884831 RepID=A0A953JCM0_9BACT|nr:hypothetical protein [Candidatus Nitrobium versatile]